MGVKRLAAIDVGSYELNLKIFEFVSGKGMKEVDSIRYRIDLGTDSFTYGKLPTDKVNELCRVLKEFTHIMKEYGVTDYRAYGTSAIREVQNTKILLDHISQTTGIRIEVLSNSKQRFLDYKSVAAKGEHFHKFIEKGTAFLDIGGGSIQLSLFDKDTLIATQNMKLGVLRLKERLQKLSPSKSKYEYLLDEMISSQLDVFKKLYLKDREIENVILVDDYISALLQRGMIGASDGYITIEKLSSFMKDMKKMSTEERLAKYDVGDENHLTTYVAGNIVEKTVKALNAKLIWAPGSTLSDGIAYEYAEEKKLLKIQHNFEEDIVACAQNISKRYMGSKKRSETLESIALNIFDHTKKNSGLTNRDRLLLRIATLLHDCGKYISLYNLGMCSYNIIMATEIIGLSHEEREIVANVVKYNHFDFEYYEEMVSRTMITTEDYMRIAKLCAILRVANGLDRSHKEKFRDITTKVRDSELIITVHTNEDITLEKGLLQERADFFEEIFNLKPVVKQKKEL